MCFHGEAFNISYIIDSNLYTSAAQREGIFAFP